MGNNFSRTIIKSILLSTFKEILRKVIQVPQDMTAPIWNSIRFNRAASRVRFAFIIVSLVKNYFCSLQGISYFHEKIHQVWYKGNTFIHATFMCLSSTIILHTKTKNNFSEMDFKFITSHTYSFYTHPWLSLTLNNTQQTTNTNTFIWEYHYLYASQAIKILCFQKHKMKVALWINQINH